MGASEFSQRGGVFGEKGFLEVGNKTGVAVGTNVGDSAEIETSYPKFKGQYQTKPKRQGPPDTL